MCVWGGFLYLLVKPTLVRGAFRWWRSFRHTLTHSTQRYWDAIPWPAFILRFVHHKMTLSPHYPRSRNSGLTNRAPMLVSHITDKLISGSTANSYISWAPAAASIEKIQSPCSNGLTNNTEKPGTQKTNHIKSIASSNFISNDRPPL